MKKCAYCGHESPDDSKFCPGCGTEFSAAEAAPEVQPGERSGRPPRPDAASIVLRSYSVETAADRALTALRNARIESFVATDDCGGSFPPLNAMYPFRLIVSAVHREAAEQVLAETEAASVAEPSSAVEPVDTGTASSAPKSSLRPLAVFALGGIAGALVLLGYQNSGRLYTGTIKRDSNHDGRLDAWHSYIRGTYVRFAADNNDDERPDAWTYYEKGVAVRWERDLNFDGKVDAWGTYDDIGRNVQSKYDIDFDGQPDTKYFYRFNEVYEQHTIAQPSGLVWKKCYYTNGILRTELLDRDRDGKFDEKISFDVFENEIKKEQLK